MGHSVLITKIALKIHAHLLIRITAQSPHKHHTQGSESLDKNRKSNIGDAGSRIGIKGKHDIGEGNAIIYNLEWGFDGVSNSAQDSFYHREAWMGISGKMGTLKAGRQKNPFQQMLHDDSILDGFNGEAVIQSAASRTMSTILMNP